MKSHKDWKLAAFEIRLRSVERHASVVVPLGAVGFFSAQIAGPAGIWHRSRFRKFTAGIRRKTGVIDNRLVLSQFRGA
jgi:hypothetical protein